MLALPATNTLSESYYLLADYQALYDMRVLTYPRQQSPS